MTPILKPHILNARQLHNRDLATASVTAIVAVIAFMLIPTSQDAIANDRAYNVLRAACKFPSNPGEATTYAVTQEGKIYCWEMGR